MSSTIIGILHKIAVNSSDFVSRILECKLLHYSCMCTCKLYTAVGPDIKTLNLALLTQELNLALLTVKSSLTVLKSIC